MFSARHDLLGALVVFTLIHVVTWWRGARWAPRLADVPAEVTDARPPTVAQLGVGFATNFFDTLGIGSFAPTTSLFTFTRMVPDRLIPGTMNVGDTLPTIVEAFIFIDLISVEPRTMLLLIGTAIAGAWMGAGIVAGWNKRRIQMGMGLALVAAASLMLLSLLRVGPPGGTALALSGPKLAIGAAGNFALGVLMPLGIGLYAPCLIMISLLGMDPLAAFPIMMGSCAFLMPISGARFIHGRCYARRPALGLAIGGVPGVLLAAYVVKSLPLRLVRWLVVIVVFYTATVLLRAARRQ